MTHKDAQQGTGKMPQGSWLKGIGETLNDISIILLSENVKFSNHVLPACLPSLGLPSRESNKKGFSVFVSGWGTTKLGYEDEGHVVGLSSSPVPKQVQLGLTTENQCNLKSNRLIVITVIENTCFVDMVSNISIKQLLKIPARETVEVMLNDNSKGNIRILKYIVSKTIFIISLFLIRSTS